MVRIINMTYYKAFDPDMSCQGLQYAIGETTTVEGELKMGENGIHCCENILSCLRYYPRVGIPFMGMMPPDKSHSRFCEVRSLGKSITEGDETVCETILVLREIVGEELIEALTGVLKWEKGDGRVVTRRYVDGWICGLNCTHYKNGELAEESYYSKGYRHGSAKSWYENGQIWELGTYKNGVCEGLFEEWHDNGQMSRRRTFANDLEDGEYKVWHSNGQLWASGTYAKGNEGDGEHNLWYATGQQHESRYYIDGCCEEFKRWKVDGSLETVVSNVSPPDADGKRISLGRTVHR